MARLSQGQSAENQRAVERALALLKPGDRLAIATCGGRTVTVTMTGWSKDFPGFIASKTLDGDELHPINVRKVNGEPVSFADTIEIGGRSYRKFIRYPGPVEDGTGRCIRCGQIDEQDYHDRELCLLELEPA